MTVVEERSYHSTLWQAINRLRDYERLYKSKYPGMYVTFSLIAVSTIDYLTDKNIEDARMEKIENMIIE